MKKIYITIEDVKVMSSAILLSISTPLTHRIGDIIITMEHVSSVSLSDDQELLIQVEDDTITSIKYLGIVITDSKDIRNFMQGQLSMGVDLYKELGKIKLIDKIKATLPTVKLVEVLKLMGH